MAINARRPAWLRYTVAVIGVGLSLALGLHVRPSTYTTPYLFFYPSVLIALWFGGFGAGILATALSAVVVNWYFLPPFGAASLSSSNLLRGVFFCFSFALICWLIDARKIRAEERIERQLRLLDLAGEPIIVRDTDDKIVFWNKGAEQLYGWTKEEALGTCIYDLLRTSFPKPLAAIRRELMHEGGWRGELEQTRKDGSKVRVASSWTLDVHKSGKLAVMETNFDLTETERAEEALVRSEKLAALGRMAATIAHEVNNPLAAVMNSIYLASCDPALGAETRTILDLADQELRRAAHITAQALVFCRDTGNHTLLHVPQLVDQVLDVYAQKLRDRRIRVDRRQRCGGCGQDCEFCFVGNTGELRQVLSNLLGNAIDALNDDGVLTIRINRVSSVAPESGPRVRITIADNGSGIRAENLKRIFEPFFTTKQEYGTGLGLWISEQIITRYGGTIRVRSTPQRGTVFTVTLPARSNSACEEVAN